MAKVWNNLDSNKFLWQLLDKTPDLRDENVQDDTKVPLLS